MVINTNITAQTAARLLGESSRLLAKSLARLASGSKLVSPEDDVAGMAVSMRFDAQINRISGASSNLGNAISFSQTEDGFLKKIGKGLDRMSELAMLAQDVTKTDSDRGLYNKEFQTLAAYISDVGTKDFNGVSLFSGNALGVTSDSEGGLFQMEGISANYGLSGANGAADISTLNGAKSALTTVKSALDKLAADRATVGANISRLNLTSGQLSTLKDNLSAANSRIKDVDIAEESIRFARYNMLVQAGTAMLSQANTMAKSVLRLLG